MRAHMLVAALSVGFAAAPINAAQAARASATFSIGMTILPASTQVSRPVDPLAASTWHAAGGPWPGSVRFGGQAHTVHLALDGARPVDAAYSTVIEAPPTGNDGAGPRGRLHITPANGLAIDLAFRLSRDGGTLTLVFERAGITQHYVRVALPDRVRDPPHPQAAMARK